MAIFGWHSAWSWMETEWAWYASITSKPRALRRPQREVACSDSSHRDVTERLTSQGSACLELVGAEAALKCILGRAQRLEAGQLWANQPSQGSDEIGHAVAREPKKVSFRLAQNLGE